MQQQAGITFQVYYLAVTNFRCRVPWSAQHIKQHSDGRKWSYQVVSSEQETPPMVCGHGGDAAQAPPNTMRAFHAAVDGGVRCLEVNIFHMVSP